MKAAILGIGDELLNGQVTNSNASWISRELGLYGIEVVFQLTIGDEILKIQNGIEKCLSESEVTILTGGLGPTDDDLTVDAICSFLKLERKFDPEWHSRMEQIFKSRGREMPANNKKQAMVPVGAKRIDNDCGTAPGLWFEFQEGKFKGKYMAVLPGVPYEMQSMMKRFVMPFLDIRRTKNPSTQRAAIVQKTIFTTGIGESALAQKFEEECPQYKEILNENLKLAWLPSPIAVKLRLTSKAKSEEIAKAQIERFENAVPQSISSYKFGSRFDFEEVYLEQVVGEMLSKHGYTVSTAESCTGGLISNKLTNIAGSSKYVIGGVVAYSNDVKVKELGVSEKVLQTEGAVSENTARQMSEGALKKFGSTIAISVTGIAGPDGGTDQKPVGTVWFSLSDTLEGEIKTLSKKLVFEKDRLRNKERTAQAALDMIRRRLKEAEKVRDEI